MTTSDSLYQSRLAMLSQSANLPLLTRLQRGIEKEGLRCQPDGMIAQTRHPLGLGSALTHPSITTDYSESLLEFITPVFTSAHEALAYLDVAHRFAYTELNDELIWPASMPCILNGEMSVPIAEYGSSNLGKLKHVYRHGLWHRYGRIMQCISGIHYNFSLPDDLLNALAQADGLDKADADYGSTIYLRLIRNFQRHSWLLMYLFGASPAVCETFLEGEEHDLERLHKHTLYGPYATSLRMSDLGYQNNAQSDLMVCHNSLERYVTTLTKALAINVPAYEEIGVQGEDGEYKQLNTHLLQIENEYYSNIRPKRIGLPGEKPLQSLARAGIQYIEVRCTDVNPLLPVGIDIPQMHFMDIFLTWCAITDSPEIDEEEYHRIRRNYTKAVNEGRRPELTLERGQEEVTLTQWGLDIVESLRDLAQLLDTANGHCFHVDTLNQQRLKLADSSLTPSAKLLREMQESGKEFATLTLEQAKQHRRVLSEPLAADLRDLWRITASKSRDEQLAMETDDVLPFADYLASFLQR
ncbi:MAG: glutamate--cysteine ligase [Oleibacter sp.]|nr:glutamate--cysteine ligase [Thalassolituus sp.]